MVLIEPDTAGGILHLSTLKLSDFIYLLDLFALQTNIEIKVFQLPSHIPHAKTEVKGSHLTTPATAGLLNPQPHFPALEAWFASCTITPIASAIKED